MARQVHACTLWPLSPHPPPRYAELLGSADLAPSSGLTVRGTGVKSCEGEARRGHLAWAAAASPARPLLLPPALPFTTVGILLARRPVLPLPCCLQAVVNNRKNKVIAAYEISLVLGWEGSAPDGAAVTGACCEAGGVAASGVWVPRVLAGTHAKHPCVRLQARCGCPISAKRTMMKTRSCRWVQLGWGGVGADWIG